MLRCNQTFLDLVGRPSEVLVDTLRFADLLTRGGQIYFETHCTPLLRLHGRAQEIALEIARPDGRRVPVLLNATVDQASDGPPVLIHAAVFEAAQRRNYELELLEQSKRLATSEAHARALAATLQQTLLPPLTPQIAGLDLGACYRPSGDGGEVGGDFYDLVQTGADAWMVALGDVCGKGVDAAVLTALIRYTLRAAAMQDASPAHALTVVNDVLHAEGNERHATVACLRLDRHGAAWRVRAAYAGHPLALLRRRDGSVDTFGVPGQAVGLFPEITVQDDDVELHPGDALLLYTDGIPEARHDGRFFGEDRLVQVLAAPLPAAQQRIDELLRTVMDYQDQRSSDDIAAVLLRVPEGGAEGASVLQR